MGFFRAIGEFLTFKRMMGPFVLQILFWVCAVMVAIIAARMIDAGRQGGCLFLAGGLIGLRVLFEMVLVFFRIHNRLTELQSTMKSVDSTLKMVDSSASEDDA